MTVKQAVYIAYFKLPQEFGILDLISSTRRIIDRPHLTDGTITKELRNLRADDVLNYEVTDQIKGKYKKKFKGKQLKMEI